MKTIQSELEYPCIGCVTAEYDKVKVSKLLQSGEDVLLKAPKPKKKIIPLDDLIGSDILCEFSTTGNIWTIGKLEYTDNINLFKQKETSNLFKKCRIMQNHWHSFRGNKCPLPDGLKVTVRYVLQGFGNTVIEEKELDEHYDSVNWYYVVAYKVTGTQENACYEWEKDE